MNKKIIATLTALLCCTSMALSVSAQVDFIRVSESLIAINGNLVSHYQNNLAGVLVQTDGTELTEDMVSGIDGYKSLEDWATYSASLKVDETPDTELVPDGNGYMILLDTTETDLLNAAGRLLQMDMDCITNVMLVEFMSCSPIDIPSPTAIAVKLADEAVDITSITALEEFSVDEDNSFFISGGYVIDLTDTENSELFADIKAAGLETEYDYYMYMKAFADSVVAENPDIIVDAYPFCLVMEVMYDYGFISTSTWQTAGDHNADGETNSNDAAALLVQAAEDGAAEASAETVSPDSDVNLDGVADATDAAYILQYSALKGAGMDPDWVEILMKN